MNVFELFATLSLDKQPYEDGLNSAETSASKIGSKISSGLGALAKGTAIAIGATTTAVAGLVKASVESYADFEQLVGGVQTLFGEISKTTDASVKVLVNAGNAYKTAGLSANEYMETVTSFSASLMASLDMDAEKASAQADKAIVMMADNANKMGTSMESIQNAYMGFAKQNYTMLDNLKLGYGGTKEEMQRLLSDAQAISGVKYDIQNYSDLIDAIGVIQDKMGITGTTAKEASTTISGSLNSLKAVWSNVVTDFASGNGDLGDDLINLTDAFKTFAGNVIPAVETAISGVAYAIGDIVPEIMSELPNMINEVLPDLLEAGVEVLQAIIGGIVNNIDSLIDCVFLVIEKIVDVLIGNAPMIIDAMIEVVNAVVEKVVELLKNPESLSGVLQALLQITLSIAKALIEMNIYILQALPEILKAIVNWIVTDAIPQLVQAVADLWGFLFSKSDELTDGFFSNAIAKLQAFLKNPAYYVGLAIGEMIGKIANFFSDLTKKTVEFFTVTMPSKWNSFKAKLSQLPNKIVNMFKNLPSKFKEIGSNIVSGIWTGISNGWKWLTDQVSSLVSGLVAGVKKTLGIHSPSKVFAGIGQFMAEGLGEGWSDEFSDVQKNIENGLDFSGSYTDLGMTSRSINPIADVLGMLQEYLPQLANTQLVLDTGATVGQLAPAMDVALGRRLLRNGRMV